MRRITNFINEISTGYCSQNRAFSGAVNSDSDSSKKDDEYEHRTGYT